MVKSKNQRYGGYGVPVNNFDMIDLIVIMVLKIDVSIWYSRPDQVTSTGHLNHEGGVDTDVSGTFIYNNGGTARFQTHCRVNLNCEGIIYGTKGKI